MKLVAHLSHMNWPVEGSDLRSRLSEVASLVDAGGFDGLATADHLWQHPIMGGPAAPCLEAYTTLAFLAAQTTRVRLLTVVTGVHFRYPAVLAKTVTSLDVLSGGRAWLGIGAGHFEEECVGLGVPFPALRVRYELLEDALEVCLRMWEGAEGSDKPFAGHHVRAERMLNVPQAVQRPHPPILIAGTGERRTLPLVARYGDACSLRPGPEIPAKLEVLRRACGEAGTDFERIERTCAYAFNNAVPDATNQLLSQLRSLADLGIDTVIGRVDGEDPRPVLEWLATDVVAAAAEFGSRR
jgi:F420-dependent oxidoreductase-like protein